MRLLQTSRFGKTFGNTTFWQVVGQVRCGLSVSRCLHGKCADKFWKQVVPGTIPAKPMEQTTHGKSHKCGYPAVQDTVDGNSAQQEKQQSKQDSQQGRLFCWLIVGTIVVATHCTLIPMSCLVLVEGNQ